MQCFIKHELLVRTASSNRCEKSFFSSHCQGTISSYTRQVKENGLNVTLTLMATNKPFLQQHYTLQARIQKSYRSIIFWQFYICRSLIIKFKKLRLPNNRKCVSTKAHTCAGRLRYYYQQSVHFTVHQEAQEHVTHHACEFSTELVSVVGVRTKSASNSVLPSTAFCSRLCSPC